MRYRYNIITEKRPKETPHMVCLFECLVLTVYEVSFGSGLVPISRVQARDFIFCNKRTKCYMFVLLFNT